MLGFDLVRTDGATVRLEATHYDVDDDGSIVVFADGNKVFQAPAGSWIEIREIGARLTSDWPPANLDYLLENLSHALVVRYGHTLPAGIGPASSYQSGVLNELDALTAAVLERAGLDAHSSDRAREAEAVRSIIKRHFHLGPTSPPPG